MAIELYTLSDVAKILGIKRERCGDWLVRGFIQPSAKSKGQGKPAWFTRGDIYLIRLFVDMIDRGIDRAEATKYVDGLRESLLKEGFLAETKRDEYDAYTIDRAWAAISIKRGDKPKFAVRMDNTPLDHFRQHFTKPDSFSEDDQNDFVMLFNLFALVTNVNKACEEYGRTI